MKFRCRYSLSLSLSMAYGSLSKIWIFLKEERRVRVIANKIANYKFTSIHYCNFSRIACTKFFPMITHWPLLGMAKSITDYCLLLAIKVKVTPLTKRPSTFLTSSNGRWTELYKKKEFECLFGNPHTLQQRLGQSTQNARTFCPKTRTPYNSAWDKAPKIFDAQNSFFGVSKSST